MSNDEAMNRSIKATLSKHVFPGMLPEAINGMSWPEWDAMVATFTADYAKRRGGDLQKYASPDELRYICENLTTEASAKLGLKLPEKKLEYTIPANLSPDVVEWLKANVKAGKCTETWSCPKKCDAWSTRRLSCSPICGDPYGAASEFLEMFKTIIDAQLPPLKCNVPDLDAEEREHVEVVTRYLEEFCTGDCLACEPIMGKIFGKSRCYLHHHPIGSPERAQIIDALKAVLKQQKPLLPPHNVIQLPKQERENWKRWLECKDPRGTCPHVSMPGVCDQNNHKCKPIFPELNTSTTRMMCPCNNYPKEAVRTIIEQCIALGPKAATDWIPLEEYIAQEKATIKFALKLPPHNLDKLPRPQYDTLEKWRAEDQDVRNENCPREYGRWEACESCKRIFPELDRAGPCADDGPCATYGDEKVCAVVDKILALGPKFEEYNAWGRENGKKVTVYCEGGGMVHFRHENGNETCTPVSSFRNGYTKTPPPPKEKFQQYVAVETSYYNNKAVSAVLVIDENRVRYPSGASLPLPAEGMARLHPITNPLECRDMLNKVLGEKSMVEAIKAFCEKRIKEWQAAQPEDSHGLGYTSACGFILQFIADLERKAK